MQRNIDRGDVVMPSASLVSKKSLIKLWPKVDAMICFYSDGFPYLMAWKYVKAHNPFLINSLDKQQLLWDRTVVYDILKKIKVPVAKHYYIFQDLNYIDEIEAKGFGNILPDPLGFYHII
uniref:VIP1 N-terminal domain-containing protein n=1 Tax=Nymphaea colorata TaxID=210225 RepID=A0A5K1HFV4_9MAGN|nr:unnamed protein product [Nymphaea colorata]